jgi:type II secretion system protein N
MKMKLRLKITRHTLGYAVFTVSALIVFAYLRFPGDIFARYLTAAATDMSPGIIMKVDSVKPALPPGIMLDSVTLRFPDSPQAAIQTDAIMISPAYLPLFKGHTAAAFTLKSYGGAINGQAQTRQFMAFDGPLDWKVNLDGIDLGKIGYLKERLGRQITGSLTGSLNYNGLIRSLQNGAGTFEFTLAGGSYPFRENIMGMDRLDFRKVEAAIGIKNGVLTINRLRLTGDKVNGVLTGNIVLNDTDIKNSQLSLNFTFELQGHSKKISMVMTGILANPSIKFV